MKKEFDIEKILIQKEISPNYLAEEFGFKIYSSGETSLVESAPKKIQFGDGLFFVSLFFRQEKLSKVDMVPLLEDVDEPNYPSEDYQSLKMNYCKKILRKIYGKEDILEENSIEWENEHYTIGCYSFTCGKGAYTGGNIIIYMK